MISIEKKAFEVYPIDKDYYEDDFGNSGFYDKNYLARETFINACKELKEQMMKEAVEGEVMLNAIYPYEPRIVIRYPDCPYQLGDKVRIVIVKED